MYLGLYVLGYVVWNVTCLCVVGSVDLVGCVASGGC